MMSALGDEGLRDDAVAATVLVVEDDGVVAADVKDALVEMGYQVPEVIPKGEWAVTAAREHGPDLVLMDIRLAGVMDGVEAGAALDEELDVPVVYLTAYADDETRSRARRTAPHGYVVKPFTDRDLQTSVEVALVRHRMEKRLDAERARLRESERRFRQLAEAVGEAFWLRDPEGEEVLYVSPAFEEIWGRPVAELYENPRLWIDAVHPDDRDHVAEAALGGRDPGFEEEYRVVRPDGEVRWVRDQAFPVTGDDGEVRRVAGVARDVTERKRFEEQLQERALHDYLTGLPNRALFHDRLEHALERVGRDGGRLAVLFVDLKRFKVVNDSLGHEAGDRVLEAVARRLEEVVRGPDTVARVGGDEFTVLLEDVGEESAVEFAERLVDAFRTAVPVDGHELQMEASIGVAVHSADRDRQVAPPDLVRSADAAMYRAKDMPGTRYVLAEPSEDRSRPARLERESRLREALDEGRVRTVYQPIYALDSGRVRGVEALARWHDPELGDVSPGTFIPLAEETGLIIPLGEQQIERASSELLGDGFADPETGQPVRLHVNLSARQLDDPEVVDRIRSVLEGTGFPPSRLCLEITESAAMRKPETVERLKGIGAALALDDFGTRYSTLSQLRRLTVDALKIDRTFVDGLPDGEKDRAIVETVLTLGRTLGLDVVAEGIENEEQARALRELGCGEAQGFHLARPMDAEELRERLAEARGDGA